MAAAMLFYASTLTPTVLVNSLASLSMMADDLSLAAAAAFFAQSSGSQEARDAQLKRRLPQVPLARSAVAKSMVSNAGLGLFATRDIACGELVTFYPGDAIAVWKAQEGGSSIRDAIFEVSEDAEADWVARWKDPEPDHISRCLAYTVRTATNRAIIGDPAQCSDPAYLGHMANDAAMCVGPGTAKQVYELASEAAANVGLVTKSVSGCHHAVVATKPIASGCEIFMSYGSSYWLTRLPVPPTRCPFPDGSEYYGEMVDDQIHGCGELTDAEGNLFVGEFVKGSFEGVGTQFYADGRAEACRYLAGEAVGVGVGWSSDRAQAYRIVHAAGGGGVARTDLSLEDAASAAEDLGVPVPRAHTALPVRL